MTCFTEQTRGSTPSTGNPIKSKRIAPFTAESYESHCRRVGGPSIKFACSVNLNYYTVAALVDAVCIYMMYFARYPGFFLSLKCFSTRISLTRIINLWDLRSCCTRCEDYSLSLFSFLSEADIIIRNLYIYLIKLQIILNLPTIKCYKTFVFNFNCKFVD